MLQVVVFDDDRQECMHTGKILERYAGKKNIDMHVNIVCQGERLLEYIKRSGKPDVVFLDVQVGDKPAGIDITKKINHMAPDVAIVFLTGYLEYATEIYETKHVYFVLKEELEKRLDSIFRKLDLMAAEKRKGYIHLHAKGKEIVIHEEEILYIERQGRTTRIQCSRECIDVPDRLSELEEKLDAMSFVKCHNSFIVNFNAVKEFTRTEFILNNGIGIPVSRYKIDETRKKFFDWSAQHI